MDAIEQDTIDYTPQQNEPTQRLAAICPHCQSPYPNEAAMQCPRCGNQRVFEGTYKPAGQ